MNLIISKLCTAHIFKYTHTYFKIFMAHVVRRLVSFSQFDFNLIQIYIPKWNLAKSGDDLIKRKLSRQSFTVYTGLTLLRLVGGRQHGILNIQFKSLKKLETSLFRPLPPFFVRSTEKRVRVLIPQIYPRNNR